MKNRFEFDFIFIAFLGVLYFAIGSQDLFAQDAEKNRVRLKVDYIKIMNEESYLNIGASARIEKQNVDIPDIQLTIYNEIDDEEIEIGTATTNALGKSMFVLPNLSEIKADSSYTYTLGVSFDGNESYKRASKAISFKNADIEAKSMTKDSVNYITAILRDSRSDSLIVGESMNVQVQRLFSPLKIGEEFNETDENGTILVPVEADIPGVDGNLTFEVVLEDNDTYGTVIALVDAPIGIPIVEESTFDQRTLWSPRNKTPIFILVCANVLIFGIWGLIIYLFTNLFKIAKS